MLKNTICPSCNSENIVNFSEISSEEIKALYEKNNIFLGKLFNGIRTFLLIQCKNCELKFFLPAVSGDENFYNQLQEMEWYFLHADKTEFTFSAKFIAKDNKVLDVGSGRGVWSKYVKDGKGAFYQGIEFSSNSIKLAEEDRVNVIKESVEEHAAKFANHYDVVAAFQVLEHIENIKKFTEACISCLKVGGKLILAVPNNDGFIKAMTNNWLNLPPHHINHWNEKSLIELGKNFNLKILEIYKENVTPVHKLLFNNIRIFSKLSGIIDYKSAIIDHSLKFKILNKLSFWLAKLAMPFSKKHLKSEGHSIIVVFEKIK